jgi:hypothetical protein
MEMESITFILNNVLVEFSSIIQIAHEPRKVRNVGVFLLQLLIMNKLKVKVLQNGSLTETVSLILDSIAGLEVGEVFVVVENFIDILFAVIAEFRNVGKAVMFDVVFILFNYHLFVVVLEEAQTENSFKERRACRKN